MSCGPSDSLGTNAAQTQMHKYNRTLQWIIYVHCRITSSALFVPISQDGAMSIKSMLTRESQMNRNSQSHLDLIYWGFNAVISKGIHYKMQSVLSRMRYYYGHDTKTQKLRMHIIPGKRIQAYNTRPYALLIMSELVNHFSGSWLKCYY